MLSLMLVYYPVLANTLDGEVGAAAVAVAAFKIFKFKIYLKTKKK